MECRVGLPTDGIARWRCDICSQINVFTNDQCLRCQEPYSADKKQQHKVKKGRVTNPVPSAASQSRSRAPSKPTPVLHNPKQKIAMAKAAKGKENRPGKTVSGVGSSKVSTSSSYKMKKLKKEDLSTKHLGYKSGKKRNVGGMVRSKLNHDTASYRAKFVGKGNPNDVKGVIKGMRKGSQYATMGDLTKNGWTTSVGKHKAKEFSTKNMSEKQKARNRAIVKLNDARPVTPPPKRGKGQRKAGLLDQLQKAHSGEIMANMRSKGRYMRPATKDMGGGKSAYTL